MPMTRFVVISDTHGRHAELDRYNNQADVLIHCGDAGYAHMDYAEAKDFLTWLAKQPAELKIYVPGNHDSWMYRWYTNTLGIRELDLHQLLATIPDGDTIRVLINQTLVYRGIKIFGMPWVNHCGNWVFMARTGEQERMLMNPEFYEADILVSHGPSYGTLDCGYGSKALAKAVHEATHLKVHFHGHIHETYGHGVTLPRKNGKTLPVFNAALMGDGGGNLHAPIVWHHRPS